MKFGVNTWVWTSPLTTTELEILAPLVAGVSFDWIEVPLESLDVLAPPQGADFLDGYKNAVICDGILESARSKRQVDLKY